MAKIIITFLLFAVQLQAQNTWVSGGGGDTSGIVHNAIKIKGVPVSLIPPTDNFILKYDSAVDSFLLEIDDTGAGGQWTDFGTYLKPIDDADVALHLGDTADNDSLIIAIDGSGNVTFTTTTGNIIFTTGNTGNSAFQLPASSVSSTEILNATIQGEDLQTGAIDSIGKLGDGLWNTAVVATFASGADTVLFRDATNGNIVKGILSITGMNAAAFFDSLNNYDNDIIFTQGLASYAANSVSADELNATGVETELEAVMDLEDMQGAVTDGQVPDGVTATNYLLLAAILDSLNNYDSDILFTQGITTIAANSIDSDSYIDGSIDNEHLVDNAVNSQELAAAAVTQAKFGFHVWEKTIAFPDTLKSNAQDTIWFARNHFGVTITIDSIYVESDVDNYDISVVKSDVGGHSPTLVDAIQAVTNGSNHFYTTETTISSATVTASQRLGFVLTTDNANYVTIIISAAW